MVKVNETDLKTGVKGFELGIEFMCGAMQEKVLLQ
jgi:hypothetical protein